MNVWKLGLACGASFLVGLAAAFFLAAPAMFSDGPDSERLVVVAVLAAIVGLLGFGIGAWLPHLAKITPWFLAAPTWLVVGFFFERHMFRTAALLIAGATGFALAGSLVGARLRRRKNREA